MRKKTLREDAHLRAMNYVARAAALGARVSQAGLFLVKLYRIAIIHDNY